MLCRAREFVRARQERLNPEFNYFVILRAHKADVERFHKQSSELIVTPVDVNACVTADQAIHIERAGAVRDWIIHLPEPDHSAP